MSRPARGWEAPATALTSKAGASIRCPCLSGLKSGQKMKKDLLLVIIAASLAFTTAATTSVRAGNGDVAAGLLGGFAAGTIIGAAVVAPR